MADEDLRALERRYRVTGEASDVAAWARAAVRAGVYSLEGLALASYLRSDEALLLGRSLDGCDVRAITDDMVDSPHALGNWGRGLEFFRKGACLRALCALDRHLVATRSPPPEVLPLVDALERYALAPSKAALAALAARTPPPGPESTAGNLLLSTLQWTHRANPGPAVRPALEAALIQAIDHVGRSVADLRAECLRLCAVICAELQPWALGTGDPLAERHLVTSTPSRLPLAPSAPERASPRDASALVVVAPAELEAAARAGTLPWERLLLAAYCGHPSARAVVMSSSTCRAPEGVVWTTRQKQQAHIVALRASWNAKTNTDDWFANLGRWSPDVAVRALLACARTPQALERPGLPALATGLDAFLPSLEGDLSTSNEPVVEALTTAVRELVGLRSTAGARRGELLAGAAATLAREPGQEPWVTPSAERRASLRDAAATALIRWAIAPGQ